MKNALAEVNREVDRQDKSWGKQDYVPDDRWMEIVEDEFRDLKWAVRLRAEFGHVEKKEHDINHELVQTIATLTRWLRARTS